MTLLVVQAACLVTGLWIHHRLVLMSALQSRIEMQATALQTLASAWDSGDVEPAATGAPFWVQVDEAWRVESSSRASVQDAIVWEPQPFALLRSLPERWSSGRVRLGDQWHLAVSRAESNAHHVVLIAPVSMTAIPPGLQSPWSLAAIASFIWIGSLLAISTYMVILRLFEGFDRERNDAQAQAHNNTESMSRMQDAVIFGLAKLTESRDPETGFHLERISLYSSVLAKALRRRQKFRDEITPEFVRLIETSSILHDIGKVGVEDAVLLKPGPLEPEERERMQTHAVIGGNCLQDIERRLGRSNFLQMARQIAFSHHERWDGQGYPEGLAGEQIPLAARIVAIVDVYEALSSKRVYKEPLPHAECVEFIRQQSGKHFDPQIADVFIEIEDTIFEIGQRFGFQRPSEPASSGPTPCAAPLISPEPSTEIPSPLVVPPAS